MDGSLGPRGYRSDRNICAAPTSVTTVRGGPGCHTTATTCAPPRALRLRLRELGKARVRLEIAPPPGDVATPFERVRGVRGHVALEQGDRVVPIAQHRTSECFDRQDFLSRVHAAV